MIITDVSISRSWDFEFSKNELRTLQKEISYPDLCRSQLNIWICIVIFNFSKCVFISGKTSLKYGIHLLTTDDSNIISGSVSKSHRIFMNSFLQNCFITFKDHQKKSLSYAFFRVDFVINSVIKTMISDFVLIRDDIWKIWLDSSRTQSQTYYL